MFRFSPLAALLLTGCVTASADDPEAWGRLDCVRQPPEFAMVKEKYITKADAAAVTATAGRSLSGIASAVETGMARRDVREAEMRACMIDAGYRFERRSAFEARCGRR